MSAGVRRLPPHTRAFAAIVLLVVLAAGVLLYGFPGRTEDLFAWTIRPDMTPILMGAGYIAAVIVFVATIRATDWHEVRPVYVGVLAFTSIMLGATIAHWDRFNHGHVVFWLWIAIYGAAPIAVAVLLRVNRADPATRSGPRVGALVRGSAVVIGAAHGALAIALLIAPAATAERVWPWALSELTGRVIAGWLAVPALALLVLSAEPRASGWRVALQVACAWWALLLLGTLRAWGDVDPDRRVAYIAAVGLLLAWALAVLVALRRDSHQPVASTRLAP